MLTRSITSIVLIASTATAKTCTNLTIPVDISSRNGVFNIDVPQSSLDPTTFIQNVTQQGRNFTDVALAGYATVTGSYNISAQFCQPSSGKKDKQSTLQILTHGIGFDKTYWDNAYNNFNYSYVNVATDIYGYSTIAIDRLGIGLSSHGEPLNEIQSFLEVAALAEVTKQLRNGEVHGIDAKFSKFVHVGHSFGSAQTYALANAYPTLTDGIILTGFSTNGSFVPFFASGADFQQANLNQPFRFGSISSPIAEKVQSLIAGVPEAQLNAYGLTDYLSDVKGDMPRVPYVNGYLTNSNANANQYLFFLPGFFDQGLLFAGEATKQPVTVGELLTLGSIPMVNAFEGPVLVITGSNDLPYCGGDCLATGNPAIPSIPSTVQKSFPNVPGKDFEVYIQPNTGHGLNFHYNATGSYNVIQNFLGSKGL